MPDQAPPLKAMVRSARDASGLSLRQLARESGVGLSYLHRLETGQAVRPGPRVLRKLATALGRDAHERSELYGELMRSQRYL